MTQREVMLPQTRGNAYLARPIMSADGTVAVAKESCLTGQGCLAVGVYAVDVPAHMGAVR